MHNIRRVFTTTDRMMTLAQVRRLATLSRIQQQLSKVASAGNLINNEDHSRDWRCIARRGIGTAANVTSRHNNNLNALQHYNRCGFHSSTMLPAIKKALVDNVEEEQQQQSGTGTGNEVKLSGTGTGNEVKVSGTGTGNEVKLSETGTGNEVKVSGTGTGNEVKVSKYLTLFETPDKTRNTQGNNPLVLLFPWLGAPLSAVQKYCDIYHQRGWDVLVVVNSSAQHFLMPSNAKVIAKDITEYITSAEVQEKWSDVIVHSMSIGSFIYTVFLIELQEQAEQSQVFKNKLRGQIFDSIVIGGLTQMGKGLASTTTTHPLGNLLIRGVFSAYLFVTQKFTVDYYNFAVKFFYDKPMMVPTLFFYSFDDELADTTAMQNLIGYWRAEHPRMDVSYKSWARSGHTKHLKLHREEYLTELTHFFAKIQLINDDNDTRNEVESTA